RGAGRGVAVVVSLRGSVVDPARLSRRHGGDGDRWHDRQHGKQEACHEPRRAARESTRPSTHLTPPSGTSLTVAVSANTSARIPAADAGQTAPPSDHTAHDHTAHDHTAHDHTAHRPHRPPTAPPTEQTAHP